MACLYFACTEFEDAEKNWVSAMDLEDAPLMEVLNTHLKYI